jgi:hypothetical protein
MSKLDKTVKQLAKDYENFAIVIMNNDDEEIQYEVSNPLIGEMLLSKALDECRDKDEVKAAIIDIESMVDEFDNGREEILDY